VKTLHHAPDCDVILRRIGALSADAPRQWGTMSAGAMVAHLCAAAEMALGDLATRPKAFRAFQWFPIKHLALYVLPIPKGAPTARELVVADAGDFEAARNPMVGLVGRMAARPVDAPGPAHPLFGTLTSQEWGALAYKHMDHHLRQFGV
jgi:hypothetical protein